MKRSGIVCLVEIVIARLLPPTAVLTWLDPLAISIGSVSLVWGASLGFKGSLGRLLSNPIVVYLGQISYGLYVWHMFVPRFLTLFLKLLHLSPSLDSGVTGFILLSFGTVVAASITWFLFEKRINGLKEHFPYHKGLARKPELLVSTLPVN